MGHGFKSGTGGGGGVGAVLTVTAPAGVTVSVSKDGKTKTKTANADGLAVFKGLATGTWTLTITDGVQTSTKPVSVTADYSTAIAFFSATINITYPAGSTCTCSDGSTTFTAPDTSGTWACIVPNTGTWTVSCTDGTDSKSEAVSITADGQSVSVKLSYWNGELFYNGDQYTDKTGGWKFVGGGSVASNAIKFTEDNYGTAYTKNKMDLSGYSKIRFFVNATKLSEYTSCVGINPNNTYNEGDTGASAMVKINQTGERTIECDISKVNSGYPFVCSNEADMSCTIVQLVQ